MRKSVILAYILPIMLFLISGNAAAQDFKRITMGAEWSYVSFFHCGTHHNFFSDIGYRVDFKSQEFRYKGSGEVYLHCGFNPNRNWNISLYAGVAGVYNLNKVVPISLRTTRYFRQNSYGDRWFAFIDGGSGVTLTSHPQAIACGKAGTGYRISLSTATKLDFVASYRMILTHPEITYDGYSVPADKINRNNAYVSGISVGLSLTF